MAAHDPLDTTTAVVTPENIAFDYQVAGPCRRFPAFLIDVAVRWLFLLVLYLVLMIGLQPIRLGVAASMYSQAIMMIMMFLITWFYGTVMEAYFNGRTVGKWMCGIRVISVDGRPVTPRSALLRNLLRVADIAPVCVLNQYFDVFNEETSLWLIVPASTFGITSMLLTQRMQRLGDLAAGTMVVVDEKIWRLPIAKVDDPRVPALAAYVPADYRVSRTMARTLGVYIERRHYLTPARRNEIAKHLTDHLVDRFEFRPDINPDLLLYALYHKTFLHDPNAEEPDLGALRGYSPLAKDMDKSTTTEMPPSTPLIAGLASASTAPPATVAVAASSEQPRAAQPDPNQPDPNQPDPNQRESNNQDSSRLDSNETLGGDRF